MKRKSTRLANCEKHITIRLYFVIMNSLDRFRRWAKEYSYRRGIICHFYISERDEAEEDDADSKTKQRQYYTKTDYAFFNLFSKADEWVVKGTMHHGVRDKYRDLCRVPCLNCFEVNKEFLKALGQLKIKGNDKFEVGVLFNKRKLRMHFGSDEVCDVDDWIKNGCPKLPNKECWRFDNKRKRKGVLDPFNLCDVVRVRIPKSGLRRLPIYSIPLEYTVGLLVRKGDHRAIIDLPKIAECAFKVFPVL